ncbi:MAG: hypothetical protein JSS10_05645 [Verrucomicrobia bacterium]|nr:hypothetical protein [Verrucomicrobiota bacterium]
MAIKLVSECSHCHQTIFKEKLDSGQPGADLILVVTQCSHVFMQACLKECFAKKLECPLDHRQSSLQECRPIEDIAQVFSELHKKDSAFVLRRLQEMIKDEPEQMCSICHKEFLPIFLISADELMHPHCWKEKNPDVKTHPVSLVPQQIATITQKGIQTYPELAKLLPALPSSALAGLPGSSGPGKSPANSPRKPAKPISPAFIVMLAVAPIISLWAFAMNTRVYRNQNPLLFVLSTPVLLIVKIFSAVRFALKRMFA